MSMQTTTDTSDQTLRPPASPTPPPPPPPPPPTIPPTPTPIMSGSVVVTNKTTVVYPLNQVKVQTQLNAKARPASPGVITSTGKLTMISGNNKITMEAPKTCPPGAITPILATRIIPQKGPSVQQHTVTTSSSIIPQSKIVINNAVAAGQIPISYEAVQVGNHQQTAIIQGIQQIQTVSTGSVKTVSSNITGVSNLHRIQTNAKAPPVNFQKVKTITSVSNQTAVVPKNLVSRIQVPKSQVTNAVHQMTPITVNQVITNVNSAPRFQPNATITVQKSQVNNQRVNPANSENHQNNKAQGIQPQTQKIPGSSQKAQNIPRQPSQSQQKQVNSVKKGAVACLQKASVQNHQGLTNAQPSVSIPGSQSRSIGAPGNILKSDNSNSNSNSQLNITKTSHAVVTVVNKSQTVVQQIIPQGQNQGQIIQKQLGVAQRIQGNVNIQPKVNVMPQTLTSLPVNAKGSTIINAKIQQSQQQMLLRLEPGKGPVGNIQGNVKTIAQKSGNIIKNSGIVAQQPLQRNTTVQPVKIIQQTGQNYSGTGFSTQGVTQKQPGCIKTIPPQKPQQRNQIQSKTGIKTSLNTNMNTLKTIGTPSTTVITQKSSIKTLLPHQQNTSSVVVQKSQPIKIQSTNIQQKQLFVASQFAQQQPQGQQQLRHGQIKTILPVTVASEIRKEMESKIEPESQMVVRDEYENDEDEEEELKAVQHSPVRRMPLPYECLQFVLQDHNYGAPPPRTPPPASPPLKPQPINNGTGPALPHQSFVYNQGVPITPNTADDAGSAISSEPGREVEPEGEETETAPEGEGDEEDSITRCICEFEHDDGYMICCDRCLVWQHVDCMGIDRSNIPDEYLCEICRPRRVDRQRARTLQMRKREELLNSDTSSDTSSTSSADTNVPAPPNPKKRNIQQSRKKADPPSQPRRLNNNNNESSSNHNALTTTTITPVPTPPTTTPIADNTNTLTPNTTASTNPTTNSNNNTTTNNNNVTKRPGRREQNPRQTSVQSRKKETVKRGPGKRKGKRRRSINDDEENQESWGTTMAPLRQWIERYEEAVTNHYSPELRARISSIKVNGTHSDLKQNNNNMSAVASGKCRVNVHSNNVKYLMATMYLSPNTPVVELRGKYMLSTQHRPAHHGQGRQHAQRPGPFVFFYRLPREGTEVCVDTRTYGNDARFVRRSCTPNAEVKHCIEKGTLHLYIVTTSAIDKNAEITIRHEQHNLLMSPNSSNTNSVGNSMLPLACACGNPRTCQIASPGVAQVGPTRRSSSGASADNSDGRERRRRGRKNVIPEDDGVCSAAGVPQGLSTTPSSSTESASTGTLGATPKRAIEPRDKPKEEVPQVAQLPPALVEPLPQIPLQTSTLPSDTPPQETKKDKKKMTREERKMEAIMKAFERLEKAEQRKQEVQARNAQRKESGGAQSDNDDRDQQPILSHPAKNQKHHVERPIRRKRRKGRARTTSTSQSSSHSRRTRLNSADSDLSSADDEHLTALQSPPLRRPPCSSLSAGQMYSPSKSDMTLRDPVNPNQVIPTAADLLLALANSNVPDAGRSMSPDRSLQHPALSKSPTCDSGASSSSQSSTPSTPLSSACLLVAAAVGPLAPGFKFPKTKKAMMNEWLRESPDLSQLPPRTLPVVSTIPVSKESPKGNDQLSSDYLNQSMNYGTKSLATLVQAANSVSGICDSPPQRKGAPCVNAQNPQTIQCPVSSGSAKKRWLRQAISEECDSPNSRPDSPPNEVVAAPPKKRRIARESLSSDNYTPPTTPTPSTADCPLMGLGMGLGDHSVTASVDNISERPAFLSSVSRSLSPTTLERQIKSYLDAEMKEEEHSEHSDMKKCEFYDICKIEKNSEVDANIAVKSECPQRLDDKLCLGNTMADIKVDDSIKRDLKNKLSDGMKDEPIEADSNPGDIEFKLNIKTEIQCKLEESSLDLNIKIVEDTVSVCDKTHEKNIDAGILEPNDTETRLEFDNSSTSEPGILSTNISPKKQECLEERSNEASKDELKLEEPMSLDEFDVEAQMKKITGDDGDDYKEKIETSSERDKSFDGIEGLMESSKEDSGSSDGDDDDELTIKTSKDSSADVGKDIKESENVEERAFKEFETLASLEVLNSAKDTQEHNKVESIVAVGTCSSEESMFDSISNLDCESVNESPKIFQSIPPLSERIRKKTESSSAPKKQLDFEAAIIESTIDMETVELSNGEHKTELSTALRQLLEGKVNQEPPMLNTVIPIDQEPRSPPLQHINESSESTRSPEIPSLVAIDVSPKCVDPVLIVAASITQIPPPPPPPLSPQGVPAPVQSEVKRLKDPRTAPHERPPPDAPPPIKRKLSISEYRKRKQQSTETPPEPEPANDASSSEKSPGRGRSDSASSGTSSLSSDEDSAKTNTETATALTNLSLLTAPDGEERKGGEEGTIGWSAEPTLVERQRENLTERLKREFGLFLSDDEEERARKQGLTAEAILKARKLSSPPQVSLAGAAMTYNPSMPPQLPPQPYIPPPGSAPIHYSQLPGKATSSQQYQNFTPPNPPLTPPSVGAPSQPPLPKQPSQFLVPQAPPGSNPYPPQFPPTANAIDTAPLFTPSTPPTSTLPPTTSVAPQKSYFSNSHPPARS